MSVTPNLSAWAQEVAGRFPGLSKPQAAGLAEWSLAIAAAGRCGLQSAALHLAELSGEGFDAVRQRLREWYLPAAAKCAGGRRAELPVTECFAPMLSWVLSLWQGDDLILALDASTLSDRFTVLAAAVLFRGTALPVAWRIVPATGRGAWKPHWLELLDQLSGLAPPGLRVLVLTDRGLYARWLFRAIREMGWHPVMRVNAANAVFRTTGTAGTAFADLVPRPGTRFCAAGIAFRSSKASLDCTLTASWGEGYTDPWFLLTDLPPEAADPAVYGLRAWMERGFRFAKSGGWGWQDTRMTDPSRAERLWLAMAVATLLVVGAGGDREAAGREASGSDPAAAPRRRVSVFGRGLAVVRVLLFCGAALSAALLRPEPLPAAGPAPPPAAGTG